MTPAMVTQHDTPVPRHTRIAQMFHWGFAVVFIYGVIKQVGSVRQLADPTLLRFEVIFAIGFLFLLAARYFYMRNTRPTALPHTTHPMLKFMARAGHLAMYASLSMIAVSGLMMGATFAYGSRNGVAMDVAVGLHEISVNAAYVTIGIHIAAAVYHRLRGDGIWSAMVPVWTERSRE